jgi:hypothetical protein
MMFIYVIAVYVSFDPGTYIVRIRFAFQNRVWHNGTSNKSEDYTKVKNSAEWRRRVNNTDRVEWKPCLRRRLHFPFNLWLSRNSLENTLVIGIKEIWSKVHKWAMCAMYQSKFRESRMFSSFLSLVKVFSSSSLVKISANCSLVLT